VVWIQGLVFRVRDLHRVGIAFRVVGCGLWVGVGFRSDRGFRI
jgi:hypothetical protein